MMWVGGALSYAGFTALCLAMDRHHQDLLGSKLGKARQRVLKVAGWALLFVAAVALMADGGWAMGLVRATGLAMGSVALLVWLLPYWPRFALALGAAALPTALLAWVF